MKRTTASILVSTVLVAVLAARAFAQGSVPTGFTDVLVRGQLDFPTDFALLPDGRCLVIEQNTARVRLVTIDGSFAVVDPVLTVANVSAGGERGLLSIAVDPGWPGRPYVYLYYDANNSMIRVSRYRAIGDLDLASSGNLQLDAASRYDVLVDIPDATGVDNGGCLRFGPDGRLFVSIGEDESYCGAQDSTSLRGVVLRIDVSALPDGPGGPDKSLLVVPGNPFAGHTNTNARLVWAMGFRNPFRFSIDPANGNLFVADVGEAEFDEVDVVDAGGQNFGWPYLQGPAPRMASCPGIVTPGTLRAPIQAYQRPGPGTNIAVVDAGVYRPIACANCNYPAEYNGDYFFADYFQGFLRRLKFSAGTWSVAPAVPGQGNPQNWGNGFQQATAFARGLDGALWYCKQGAAPNSGQIRRVLYTGTTGVEPYATVGLRLDPAVPTPARGGVRLEYALARATSVRLTIHDAQGRASRVLHAGTLQPEGRHHAAWDGRLEDGTVAPAGVYFARLEGAGESVMRRFPLIR